MLDTETGRVAGLGLEEGLLAFLLGILAYDQGYYPHFIMVKPRPRDK